MRSCLVLVFSLLSMSLSAERVELMYYNFFGDYLIEDAYDFDIDIANATLVSMKALLQKERFLQDKRDDLIESDLVIIGYGCNGTPDEFFAASTNSDSGKKLSEVLQSLPNRLENGKWRIYFIDPNISHYVKARKDHHWASPFRWLALIGMKDLRYFF